MPTFLTALRGRLVAIAPSCLAYGVAILLTVGLVGGSVYVHLASEYRQTEEGSYAQTGNLALGFAENIQRSLEAIDQTLIYVRDGYIADPQRFDLAKWTRGGPVVGRPSVRISVLDAAGALRSTNLGAVSGKVDLSDSEVMQMQRGATEDRLRIGLPVRASGNGRWVLNLTRRMVMEPVRHVDPRCFEGSDRTRRARRRLPLRRLRRPGGGRHREW